MSRAERESGRTNMALKEEKTKESREAKEESQESAWPKGQCFRVRDGVRIAKNNHKY